MIMSAGAAIQLELVHRNTVDFFAGFSRLLAGF